MEISRIFMTRIDNTEDIKTLEREKVILERIEKDTGDVKIEEEMHIKIKYIDQRIVILQRQ